MTSVAVISVGEKGGVPRIWMEGLKLLVGGFRKEVQYAVKEQTKDKIVLTLQRDGKRKVCGRKRNGRDMPIIDLNNADLGKLFEVGQKVRAVVRKGVIIIRAHAVAKKISERVNRFLTKLRNGEPLACGSVFHGGGILSKALHSGFGKAGVSSFCKVAVEQNQHFLEYSRDFNREMFNGESIFIESKIEDLSVDGAPQLDFFEAGIPCVGASSAGKAKNGIEHAEEHVAAGGMFYNFLRWLEATNPALWLLENVPNYQSSASMAAIRAVAAQLGYVLQERILHGNEFGALEARKRLCVVAVSYGLEDVFDLDSVTGDHEKPENLGAILGPIGEDDEQWSEMAYLSKKADEDKKAGKGFARQLFTSESPKINTLPANLMKRRSTDPMIQHPTNPNLCRLVTNLEHARAKDIPESMVEDRPGRLSRTSLHDVFGQGVVFSCFERVAYHIAKAYLPVAQNDELYRSAGYFAERGTYQFAA